MSNESPCVCSPALFGEGRIFKKWGLVVGSLVTKILPPCSFWCALSSIIHSAMTYQLTTDQVRRAKRIWIGNPETWRQDKPLVPKSGLLEVFCHSNRKWTQSMNVFCWTNHLAFTDFSFLIWKLKGVLWGDLLLPGKAGLTSSTRA